MPKEISRVIVALSDVRIGDDFNSRKKMEGIDELAASITHVGLIQPLVVREGGPDKTGKRPYFLVAGERRYHAVTKLGWKQVEVKLVKGDSQKAALINLVENSQRLNLEPFEEAQAMAKAMEEYKMTQVQLAEKLGKSPPYVSQRLALLKNTVPEIKTAVEKGTITATHAREMHTLPAAEQREMVKNIEAKKKSTGKDISVAEVKDEADKRKEKLGIRQERKRKEPAYDTEAIKAAKEAFDGIETSMQPKQAIFEQIGILLAKQERATSPESKDQIKYKLKALYWVTGAEKTL